MGTRCLLAMLTLVVLATGGCVTQSVRTIDARPVSLALAEDLQPEKLLDIGILQFDANLPDAYDELEERNIFPEVREAEAHYLPYELKTYLTSTGQWGAIRVLPRRSPAVDLTLEGRIEHADGEHLALFVSARDASGDLWFEDTFEAFAVARAYDEESPLRLEPFVSVFAAIAERLEAARAERSIADLRRLRTIANLRFADSFAPDAFDDYLDHTPDGRTTLRRVPAEDDGMMARIERVRAREHLFIDTIDSHYEAHFRTMRGPYTEYRASSYDAIRELDRNRREARRRMINGMVLTAAGIAAQFQDNGAARAAGAVALYGGAREVGASFRNRNQINLHVETIREAGESLASEITPLTIELEERIYTLTGTVDEKYDEWRELLDRIYRAEMGLGPQPPADDI